MDGLEIRRATPADKEAVIGISGGVYDGMDYLEDCYEDSFMNDPHTTPYVAVYNGEITAFVAAYVVDGGETVVSRAGRVKPGLSGRGFYKQLKQHCLKSSGAKINAFTVVNTNTAVSSKSFQKDNTLVLSRHMTRYDFHSQHVQLSFGNDDYAIHLTSLTEPLLHQFLTSAAYKQYLFPNDRVISNWIPYKLLQSNIPFILNADHRSLRLTDVRSNEGNMFGLLTMSKIYTGANGASACNLDIFGNDESSLKRHLASQLNFICKNSTGSIVVLVFIDAGLDAPSLEKAFHEVSGLTKTVWRSPDSYESIYTTQLLFEKPITDEI